MPLRGGEADKVGNRYEFIWTVLCMTEIMNERADSMRLEPVGFEGIGAEFWLQKGEKKEYHQVKRQNGGKGYWSLSDLEGYKILTRFAEKLQLSENNYCVFVSQDSSKLQELVERAKNSESFDEFKRHFIGKGKYLDEFDEFCRRSEILDEVKAYNILKRIVIEPIGELRLIETAETLLSTLVEGNPEIVRKLLMTWAQENIHKTLIALDIWKYLEEKDHSPSELGRGTRDFDAIEKQNQRYLSKIKDSAIASDIIPRDEVETILDHLQSSNGKRGVLISGEAGIGKSSVIVQVIEKLREKNWPILAFRIDRLDLDSLLPENVGKQLGLRDSPAKVLAAVSKGRDSVLVIDQLDTVSKASGRHHEFFDCIEEIINQAMRYPQLKLLLACRSFDLENDSRLRRLTGEKGVVNTIPLSHLPDETIRKIVSGFGLDSRRLNKRQLKLLSIPLHLSLLFEISEDSAIKALNFETATDLYHKFWEYKQEKTGLRLGEPIQIAALWNRVIDAICDDMSKRQVLYSHDYIVEDFANIATAMVSEHVLILDNKRYSFFHEGFFDYAFARRFIAHGQSLLPFLRSDEQHLFRRSQVRQILLYEHDKDRDRYTEDIAALLHSSEIRFHIKKIIFDIMKGLDDPKEAEWSIIVPFVFKAADPCSREVMRILWGSVPWFMLLDSLGLAKKWLADEDEQIVESAISLMVGVQRNLPKKMVELLEPCINTGIFIDVSDIWKKRLVKFMEFSHIDTDRTFFDFTLMLIDRGILDNIESFNPFNDNFWYHHANKLIDHHADWAAQYIGHYLNRNLFRSMINGWRNPFEGNIIPDNNDIDEILFKFLYKLARSAPEELVLEIMQFMLDVITSSAEYDTEGPYGDSIWKYRPYNDVFHTSESILKMLEKGLSILAESKPETFRIIAGQLKNENFRTIQYLVIRSYAANGEQFADDAAEFLLMNYPYGFENGYTSNPYWAARQLLEAITPYCGDDQLSMLENLILEYYPDEEGLVEDNRHRGYAQFVLLGGICPLRLSIEASNRLHELRKKFGQLTTPEEMAPRPVLIESPISEREATEMTDEQWLDAIVLYDDRNSVRDPFVGGAHELSSVLEKQVRKDPERFARLIQRFPDTAHEYYFNAVLRGIVGTSLGVEGVMQVCQRCHQLPGKPCGRWICEPIAKLAEFDLPNEALDLVAWYATEDPDPDRESWRAEKPGEVVYWGGDIIMAGLNSARGVAAMAIGTLISFDQKRVVYLRSTLEHMVKDPSISVRSWVALALNMIQDRDIAVKLFQRLCETEDVLLGTNHVEDFLRYSLATHFDALRPILERMLSSENPDVVKVGARQACLASLQVDDAKSLAKACLSGTIAHRLGAADVFAANIRTHSVQCTDNLILLFNDESDDVKAEAAGCFRHFKDDDLGKFVPLIEAFIESPAFKISGSNLVWALEKTTAEIPEITYRICERLIETIDSGDKKGHPLEEHDISTLILRLYGQKNTSEELKKKCLDLIDHMMQMESYGLNRGLDKELSLFDR